MRKKTNGPAPHLLNPGPAKFTAPNRGPQDSHLPRSEQTPAGSEHNRQFLGLVLLKRLFEPRLQNLP
jgi:hypothetical protein